MTGAADPPLVGPDRCAPATHGSTLIIPGYRGSEAGHWQTWIEGQVAGARRVSGIDGDIPVLSLWVAAVRGEITRATGPVWLVAHSFGCLAAVLAGSDRPERIAGALLVAPADPDRFSPAGARSAGPATHPRATLAPFIPMGALGFPSQVVASRDDPWMAWPRARFWAWRWGSELIDIGNAGHINTESGFGPWPEGLALLRGLQTSRGDRSPRSIRARAIS